MDAPEDLPVAGTVVLLRDTDAGPETLLMRRPDRGSFAGAWVFPGGAVEASDRAPGGTEQEDARRAAAREAFEEVGVVIDDLTVLSCWTPPAEAPKRFRTWFFLATSLDDEVRPSAAEVADVAWVRPADALARHGAGEWSLFPPTWMTLHGLLGFARAADAITTAEVAFYRTRIDGSAFRWDGLALETRTLPWTLAAEQPS
ncbi:MULTISPECIES: NUDIX domain-containing protein [unclassified Microbacterium]|uniref:NUDIX domain-containing protein n=1 Tax=unclassified Microbacterium TaxID=2609290 RepID=UPI000CFB9458|nr:MULTISPECIES: NUDIX domain-containing protein [unclassified Microbacterium]PRB06479.1 hypothetical protein CQ047_14835 [Microbacterium sp. MYb72]